MIELWYVVWALFTLGGQPIGSPHFMSGPYPSQDECIAAGTGAPYPPDTEVAPFAPVGIPVTVGVGCLQVDTDPPPPQSSGPSATT